MKDFKNNSIQSSACNCLNLRRAAQSMTRIYDRFLEPSGLKISQYSLIRHIAYLEPVNVSVLAEELKLDRTTLVRSLKPLETKGLIADLSSSGSRDRKLVLTDAGKSSLVDATQLWQNAQESVENAVGKEEMQTLTRLLLKIESLSN